MKVYYSFFLFFCCSLLAINEEAGGTLIVETGLNNSESDTPVSVTVDLNSCPLFSNLTLYQLWSVQNLKGRGLIFARIYHDLPEDRDEEVIHHGWTNKVSPETIHLPDMDFARLAPEIEGRSVLYFFVDPEHITYLNNSNDLADPEAAKKFQRIANACYDNGVEGIKALFDVASLVYTKKNFSLAKWFYEGVLKNNKDENNKDLDLAIWTSAHCMLGRMHSDPPHEEEERDIRKAKYHFYQAVFKGIGEGRAQSWYHLASLFNQEGKFNAYNTCLRNAFEDGIAKFLSPDEVEKMQSELVRCEQIKRQSSNLARNAVFIQKRTEDLAIALHKRVKKENRSPSDLK